MCGIFGKIYFDSTRHVERCVVQKACDALAHRGTDGQGILCGGNIRLGHRRLVSSLGIKANGFEFGNELVCKALRLRHPIIEVPMRYAPRSYSEGKKITWKHGLRMIWTVIKWRVLPLRSERDSKS